MVDLIIHIGIDDFDSPAGGCTTHLASIIAWKLMKSNHKLIDYPNLIRLDPAVPWKTRGNGAVALRIETEKSPDDIFDTVYNIALEYAREYDNPKQQPAIALLEGEIPGQLKSISEKAVGDLVPVDVIERVVEKFNIKTKVLKGRRGLVGAVSAIGLDMLEGDFTFEALFYRTREFIGKPRLVDPASVKQAELESSGGLFLNYDHENDILIAAPHGPDPVLLGIRGEDPRAIIESLHYIRVLEPVESIVIFRTNQHTDMHIQSVDSVCEAYPYRCVKVVGKVISQPKRITGGHVITTISDGKCSIDIAAYEPTKEFRNIVSKLAVGDIVEAYGCVRPPSPFHPATINLEKIRVIHLAEVYKLENPRCPVCGARMVSAGRGKGFKCPKCGYRSRGLSKIKVKIERDLAPGFYQPPKHSFKHLMKPIERFSIPKKVYSFKQVNPFIKPFPP
ncbi:TiaS agmantine-binding domain-containing protein [Thermogladius sp. 4427co]|uniref:TiaS agmantine-binding domain-containing protein n=1 Tax=Thermogladius sp. 4427co TaxID=3450718 RepID=UPI003F79C5EF